MINDVLTSGKGPGVIGMLLAVVVLAGFSGLGLMVLNSDSYEEVPLSERVTTQLVQLDDLEADIGERREELEKYRTFQNELSKKPLFESRLARVDERVAALKAESEALIGDIETVGTDWETYKANYRKNERARIRGVNYDLSATHGEKFKKVKITGANPIEIRAMLSSGPRGIPYQELPEDLQDLLQFDEEEANAYLVAIGKMEAKKTENLKKFDKLREEADAIQDAEQKASKIARLRRSVVTATNRARAKRSEAAKYSVRAQRELAKVNSAKAAGRMTIGMTKVSQYKRRAASARRAAASFESKAAKMSSEILSLRRR